MYHSLQQGKGKIGGACLFDKRLKFSYRSPPAVDMSLWRHLLNNVVASGRKDFFRLEKFRTIKLQPPLNGSQSISPIGSISAIQARTIKVNLHTIQSLDSRHNPDTLPLSKWICKLLLIQPVQKNQFQFWSFPWKLLFSLWNDDDDYLTFLNKRWRLCRRRCCFKQGLERI